MTFFFKCSIIIINFPLQIDRKEDWTEKEAQDVLAQFRYEQELFMGLSFETTSAFGSNAAIIHYKATDETVTKITQDNVYLVDSGGHYEGMNFKNISCIRYFPWFINSIDGTTDVTRTVHFGTPTAKQIEAYTRVLKGLIDFANLVIPEGYSKYETDILARKSLYEVGWDYQHGTSHGVGAFNFVHECKSSDHLYMFRSLNYNHLFCTASDDVYELGFTGSDGRKI